MGELEASTRLAIYGTLAPGRSNHGQIAALTGTYVPGWVHGNLYASGWGAALGFPGLRLNEDGPKVDVLVFESAELLEHWARLDAFEGAGYQRVITSVETEAGAVDACIYELVPDAVPRGL